MPTSPQRSAPDDSRPATTSATTGTTTAAEVPASPWRRRLFTALLVWMVVSFTVGALTKFYLGDTFFGPAYSEKFVGWGYPEWFRFVVGSGELFAAALLISPRFRFLGAAILVVITAGAVITHWVNHDPLEQSFSAHLHLVLSLVVAAVSRPRPFVVRDLLRGSAAGRTRRAG